MGAGEDFNPGFSFDFGSGAQEGPAQAPWEFGGERVCWRDAVTDLCYVGDILLELALTV